MRLSSTLISALLLLANALLIYFWLFDTEADLKQAEVQIRTQAFESVRKKVKSEAKMDPRLNPNLERALKKSPAQSQIIIQKAEGREPKHSEADTPEFEEVFASHIEGIEEGARLWCRRASVEVLNYPARCVYKGNCFKCGEAELIRPDSEQTDPFCSDGKMARKFDTECCPMGFSDSGYKCPDMPTCLAAEAVPAEGCACGGSEDCRFSPVGETPGCRCASN